MGKLQESIHSFVEHHATIASLVLMTIVAVVVYTAIFWGIPRVGPMFGWNVSSQFATVTEFSALERATTRLQDQVVDLATKVESQSTEISLMRRRQEHARLYDQIYALLQRACSQEQGSERRITLFREVNTEKRKYREIVQEPYPITGCADLGL
jgi:hypothetical protein